MLPFFDLISHITCNRRYIILYNVTIYTDRNCDINTITYITINIYTYIRRKANNFVTRHGNTKPVCTHNTPDAIVTFNSLAA